MNIIKPHRKTLVKIKDKTFKTYGVLCNVWDCQGSNHIHMPDDNPAILIHNAVKWLKHIVEIRFYEIQYDAQMCGS
jgi:hypothetical protein